MVKISIVMPFYNAENYLRESIQSILDQTFHDFELIAVNDGSEDSSAAIVQSFNDSRIRLITRKHNFIASLNHGFDTAHGDYIVRMDADDIMVPNRLQVQYDFMQANPQVDVCGSAAEVFGSTEGVFGGLGNRGIRKYPDSHRDITSKLLLHCTLIHPTVIIRKASWVKFRAIYLHYDCAEDYKLWTDLAVAGARFANLPNVLLLYRSSPGQTTNTHFDTMLMTSHQIRMEYAEAIMNIITGQESRYRPFFEQCIHLIEEELLDFKGFSQMVYQVYLNYLENNDRY